VSRDTLGAVWLVLMLLVLAGCAGMPKEPAGPPSGPPTDFPAAAYLGVPGLAGQRFRIVPQASELRVYVHRGGRLARLGHNHVLRSHALQGFVLLASDPRQSRADLYLPVASLEVDPPELRRQGGPELASVPSEHDIAATRGNMLGSAVLDEKHYPYVEVSARIAAGMLPSPVLDLAVTLRNTTRHRQAPAHVVRSGQEIRVTGELDLRQTDFGITPFSVLGGALTVEDQVHLVYSIVARAF